LISKQKENKMSESERSDQNFDGGYLYSDIKSIESITDENFDGEDLKYLQYFLGKNEKFATKEDILKEKDNSIRVAADNLNMSTSTLTRLCKSYQIKPWSRKKSVSHNTLTFSKRDIQAQFDYPQNIAAKNLGITISNLKAYRKYYNIDRWPYVFKKQLTRKQLQDNFKYKHDEAAKKLHVSTTTLRANCIYHNINKWPFRNNCKTK
tara:strand:- start:11790 stop:12410 length:621 start_codon:yes stop_codon:yes gene_type:complete